MLSNIEYLERGVSILGEISFASRLFDIKCVELLASSSIFLFLVICFDLFIDKFVFFENLLEHFN